MKIVNRRVTTIALGLMVLSGMPLVWAGLSRIWTREFETASFTWDRMDFEGFATNSWDGMQSQTETLALTGDGETWITVTKTDYESDMLLDIIYTCTLKDAILVATGQYCQFINHATDPEMILLTGDPFDIPTNIPDSATPSSIITNKMLWHDANDPDPEAPICRALKITFYIDTSQVDEPDGTYTYDFSVGIGPEYTP